MKIVMTGGGSGGHLYPILAIADAIDDIVKKEHLVEPKVWFVSSESYDKGLLYQHGLRGKVIETGKRRLYRSAKNFFDIFKTAHAIARAVFFLFGTYPDVVFGKGGYSSFPSLVAARLLRIPVVIHESDTVPGRVNLWAAKFAKRIAVSYPEAARYFPEDKVAWTGNPIRKSILSPIKDGAVAYLNLEPNLPTVFIIGGSQGSQKINEVILDSLVSLLPECQIIHQTGKDNFAEITRLTKVVLENNPHKERYHPFAYLDDQALKLVAGNASLAITRAGSTLFEIATWGIPSIVIPIAESNGNHQQKNAFSYARTGAAVVIEEANLAPHVLSSEVIRLLKDEVARHKMHEATKSFARLDAADLIAKELINVCLKHE